MSDQEYDSSLKSLIQDNPAEIIPRLVPGAVFEQVLDVEIIRPTMRADRVFEVKLEGEHYILDLEFETSADKKLALRLLTYHAVLQQTYNLPVLSVVVYPFKVAMAQSPFQTKRGNRDNLTFHFDTVPLWRMQAHQFVQEHVISMYALLPTMQGADEDLLMHAIEELGQVYRNDEAKLAHQLVWMGILLGNSSTVPLDVQAKVQRRIDMFEQLWERDPRIRNIISKSEARGKVEGKAEMISSLIKQKFPNLTEEAQQKIRRIQKPEKLDDLAALMMSAPDEQSFLRALEALAA